MKRLWKAVAGILGKVIGALITAALPASVPFAARWLPELRPYADWTVVVPIPAWALASTVLGLLGLCGYSYVAGRRGPTGGREAKPAVNLWEALGRISGRVIGALITAALPASVPVMAGALPELRPYADWTVVAPAPIWALASTGLGVLGLCGYSYFAGRRAARQRARQPGPLVLNGLRWDIEPGLDASGPAAVGITDERTIDRWVHGPYCTNCHERLRTKLAGVLGGRRLDFLENRCRRCRGGVTKDVADTPLHELKVTAFREAHRLARLGKLS